MVIKKILSYLNDNLETIVANFCLVILVSLLGLQVFSRYVLQMGLSWSEELSRFSFIWFVYISGSLAVQRGRHIRITALVDRFPSQIKYGIRVFADLIWVFFNGVIVVAGIMLVNKMIQHPMFSSSLYISMAYIYSVIPLAHALMIGRIIQRHYLKIKKGDNVRTDNDAFLSHEPL